ncbi:hypothetical protein [Shewanella sp. SE1]|uniref:hypothetical protein n=1 Tax=Shewanella sp. SE1 TaxID=2705014 RepID=UPI00138F9843|nr:hypothetical protein [Shewanella sp. SE1]NDO73072.1 hypothetical protein [Shewanella sp. SE1]
MSGLTDIILSNSTRVYLNEVDAIDESTAIEIENIQAITHPASTLNIVEVPHYAESSPRTLVGNATASTLELTVSADFSDNGFKSMLDTFKQKEKRKFIVKVADPSDETKGQEYWFVGRIASATPAGELDTVMNYSFSISVDGDTSDWAAFQ